jgi:adenylylsulfate kinase
MRPERRGGVVLWFTGLSGSGKSTLAAAVAARLDASRQRVEVLDGDAVRAVLSRDLGFSREDRDTQVMRLAFVARLLARNGVFVLVAAISPFRRARDDARSSIGDFVEIHVATPLRECIKRDTKGLYARAMSGQIEHFTGINDPYEAPRAPEITVDTSALSLDASVARILSKLEELGYLGAVA